MHFSRLDRRERVSRCYTLPSPRTQRIFAGPTGSIRTKKLLTHSQRITTLVSNSLTYPWARRTEREREGGRRKKESLTRATVRPFCVAAMYHQRYKRKIVLTRVESRPSRVAKSQCSGTARLTFFFSFFVHGLYIFIHEPFLPHIHVFIIFLSNVK